VNFQCIADPDTVRGFGLAGVTGITVTTPGEAVAAFRAASRDPACGIIILTEAIAAWIPQEIEDTRFHQVTPLVIEIPSAAGPSQKRKTLRQLVQEAVGIRLGNEEVK
jgi:V/A-type H+-transporting ATPase subunit F